MLHRLGDAWCISDLSHTGSLQTIDEGALPHVWQSHDPCKIKFLWVLRKLHMADLKAYSAAASSSRKPEVQGKSFELRLKYDQRAAACPFTCLKMDFRVRRYLSARRPFIRRIKAGSRSRWKACHVTYKGRESGFLSGSLQDEPIEIVELTDSDGSLDVHIARVIFQQLQQSFRAQAVTALHGQGGAALLAGCSASASASSSPGCPALAQIACLLLR